MCLFACVHQQFSLSSFTQTCSLSACECVHSQAQEVRLRCLVSTWGWVRRQYVSTGCYNVLGVSGRGCRPRGECSSVASLAPTCNLCMCTYSSMSQLHLLWAADIKQPLMDHFSTIHKKLILKFSWFYLPRFLDFRCHNTMTVKWILFVVLETLNKHVFRDTMTLLLWIIHRPPSRKFTLELILTEEVTQRNRTVALDETSFTARI